MTDHRHCYHDIVAGYEPGWEITNKQHKNELIEQITKHTKIVSRDMCCKCGNSREDTEEGK